MTELPILETAVRLMMLHFCRWRMRRHMRLVVMYGRAAVDLDARSQFHMERARQIADRIDAELAEVRS